MIRTMRDRFTSRSPSRSARPGGGDASRRLVAGLLGALVLGAPPGARAAGTEAVPSPRHEFAFARLAHASAYGGWPRWSADWPEAETHFSAGLDRLTSIDTDGQGVVVGAGDDALYDYPWLYAVEVGALTFDANEAERLREYLLRGGFLMVDDFHGEAEWAGFVAGLARIFPDRPIVELDDSTEAFHVPYDLGTREQIPGIRALMSGVTWEKGGRHPAWRGIVDDDGRLMVAINFNQDIGDAWEHADDVRYPGPLTAQAYRLGVNYVVYAMTH